jgi:peptidoglycan/LPS O-acetylase OafA/YrhL
LPFSGLSWPVISGAFVICWVVRPLEIFCFPLAAILTAVYVTNTLRNRELSIFPVIYFKKTRDVLIYVGLASYSLYLIHQPLISLVNKIAFKVGGESWVSAGPTLKLGVLAISVLPIFVISWFSYRILENGSVSFGRWLLSRFAKQVRVKAPN